MTDPAIDLIQRRLRNQKLARPEARTPVDVVRWLGAVQAQDYAAARWAIGLRARGVTDADVERAFNDGAILRTHVLRPTWHFVAPEDIRWLLTLSAPRVLAANTASYRAFELDHRILMQSRAVLERALAGGRHLTRTELATALKDAGIRASGTRLAYFMMHAELEGTICSGARRGRQFTYALLDERAPRGAVMTRDDALAELTRRYFMSHGPATARDFAWWSGLTVRDAELGIRSVAPALTGAVLDGRTYWHSLTGPTRRVTRPVTSAYLLPGFDEYVIAYRDRDLVARDELASHCLIDGRIAGTWRRAIGTTSVAVHVSLERRLTSAQSAALEAAAERYSRFLNMAVVLTFGAIRR